VSIIDDFINNWSGIIDKPLAINKKQGFILNNGMKIILNNSILSVKSREILKRHYGRKNERTN
tara:strand:- start:45 stop:233 length:189 start_codon:yes stop_codon:yes gene_type:complete